MRPMFNVESDIMCVFKSLNKDVFYMKIPVIIIIFSYILFDASEIDSNNYLRFTTGIHYCYE